MATRALKQMRAPSRALLLSSGLPTSRSPFDGHVRSYTSIAFVNPQASEARQHSMRRKYSRLHLQEKPIASWHWRQMWTLSEPPSENDVLPNPRKPQEHPLATVGDEELSDHKKYWRKRQAEAPKPVYVRQVDENGRACAIGKRKASIAQVWLCEGIGSVVVNGKDWIDYFPRADHREQIMKPLVVVGKAGLMSIECSIRGGGNTGQAEALRLGVARALLKWNPDWRAPLKKEGLFTRDSRVVESKKYGRKKARKSFTWVKR